MAPPTRLRILLVLGLLAATGCGATFFQVPRRLVNSGPDRSVLLRGARLTFTANHIPIRDESTSRGVDSGIFLAGESWGGFGIEQRVDCGVDDSGNPRVRGRSVEIRVRAGFERPVDRGYPPGTGGTLVVLESEGSMLEPPEDGRGNRCVLTREFAEDLLTAITGLPPQEGPQPFPRPRITSGD